MIKVIEWNEKYSQDTPGIPELAEILGQLGDIMIKLARLRTGDEDLRYLELILEQVQGACKRLS